MRRRWLKILVYFFAVLIVLIAVLFIYLFQVARIEPPKPEDISSLKWSRSEPSPGLFVIGNNWLRKSESGLYEMYVEGKPFERGVAIGKLGRELAQSQEEVFVRQIRQIVPSETKLTFLKYFVGWFNRNLAENVPDEFKDEIYGISTEASHEFDFIAPSYQRILNYHAAHDIGHALQNMSLVGCTSFAVWGEQTEDNSLIVARNFDFYVGDDFAKNKIIAFYNPSSGHRFMMVTFGGMAGALSGMNEEGLTVTINAAKSEIPSSSAMPVSLVAREILQYASTIGEAYAIAAKRKMFVSESFLIGSAKDDRAAVIEKTPEQIDLVEASDERVICTNHFQGAKFGKTELNLEHIKKSASMYRWQRVDDLMKFTPRMSVQRAAEILRDRNGKDNADIGLGNEKAINQLIAHHAIIFQPEKKKVWVSTAPWQLGKFVCYDLNKVFSLKMKINEEIYDTAVIKSDQFLATRQFDDFKKFSQYRFPFQARNSMPTDSLVKWNPNSYLAYMLAGDACFERNDLEKAKSFYEVGLTKEFATVQEREHVMKQLEKCKQQLR